MNRCLAIVLVLAALAFGWWLLGVVADRDEFKRQAEILYRDGLTQNATIATLDKGRETTDIVLPAWRFELDANTAQREEKRQNTKTAGQTQQDFQEWASVVLPASVRVGGGLLGNKAATAHKAPGADASGSLDAGNASAEVAGDKQP